MRTRLVWFALVVGVAAGVAVLAARLTVQAPSKFTNIVVLKGMTDQQIEATMELWGKQLGLTCDDCHVRGDYATDEMPEKTVARQMHEMVQAINEQEFFKSSGRKADCYLCHKGSKYIPAQVNN